MGVYFRTDTTRLTYGELWRIASTLRGFLGGALNKLLGVRRPALYGIRHDENLVLVPAEEVHPVALKALAPLIEDFEQMEARLAFYHTVPSTGVQGYAAVLLSPERNGIILVNWVRSRISNRGKEVTVCAVTSQLEDGRFFTTTNSRRKLNTPPEFEALRLLGASPKELSHRHQQALPDVGSPAIPIRNEEQAKNVLEQVRRINFEWHLGRGVYVPLTPQELVDLGLPLGETF